MVNGCYNQKGIITSATVQFIDGIKVVRKRNNSRHVVEFDEMRIACFYGVILRVMSLQHSGVDLHDSINLMA